VAYFFGPPCIHPRYTASYAPIAYQCALRICQCWAPRVNKSLLLLLLLVSYSRNLCSTLNWVTVVLCAASTATGMTWHLLGRSLWVIVWCRAGRRFSPKSTDTLTLRIRPLACEYLSNGDVYSWCVRIIPEENNKSVIIAIAIIIIIFIINPGIRLSCACVENAFLIQTKQHITWPLCYMCAALLFIYLHSIFSLIRLFLFIVYCFSSSH